MKIFRNIVIGIAVCLVVLGVGITIFVSTFNLNNYIDIITQSASKALGRDVVIKNANLNLDLFKGIDLNLQNITIADDENFSKAEFLRLGRLTAALDTMAFIQRREIVLTAVNITDLHVNIIRDAKGAINAQTMGPKEDKADAATAKAGASQIKTEPPQVALPVIRVNKIHVSNGSLTFEDQNAQMPMRVPVMDVTIQMDRFNLTEYFPIKVDASILSKNNNLTFQANIMVNIIDQSARLKDIVVQSDLTQIEMSQMKEAFPSLAQLPWPSIYSGRLKVEAYPMTVSAKGLSGFKALCNIENLGINVENLPIELRSIKVDIDVDLSQSALQGKFNVDVLNGEIKNFSLTAAILEKLDGVAVVGPMLTQVLKNRLNDLQLPESTFINLVTIQSHVQGELLNISSMKMLSSLMTLESQGSYDMSTQAIAMPATVTISKDLSQRLVGAIKPLKGLLNNEAELYFPGKILGNVPTINYSPDLTYIGKRVATSEATDALSQQLDKVIEKNPEIGSLLNAVLGKDAQKTSSSNDGQENINTNTSTQESSKELIKGLLNKVIK